MSVPIVNIRFTSTLTPDDESRIAAAILSAVGGILDLLPIAYVIRIDTSDSQVYQRTGQTGDTPSAAAGTRSTVGPFALAE